MTPPTEPEPYLTVKQIAERLQIGEETVRVHLRQGTLRGVRFGRKSGWRVKPSEVDAWLQRHVPPTTDKETEG